MRTWTRVPIATVGAHNAAVGDGTFTAEDLQDAVRAQGDPAIKTPKTLLGHSYVAAADGSVEVLPRRVVGRTSNLEFDGTTLYGDIHVAAPWLTDDVAATAFASRSIEGRRGHKTANGEYRMVVTGVALLSDEDPACTDLPDLDELWAAEPTAPAVPEPVAAAAPSSDLVACAYSEPPSTPVETHPKAEEATMAESQITPEATEVSTPDTPVEPALAAAPTVEDAPAQVQATETVQEAETAPEAVTVPDGFKLVDADKLAEMDAKIVQFDEFLKKIREDEAAQFADELVAASKIVEDKRDAFAARFLADPDGTRELADMLGVAPKGPQGSLIAASAAPHTPDVDYTDPAVDLPEQYQNQILANRRRRAA